MKEYKTSIDKVDDDIVSEAIRVMADGGVILYPTDTVYGLGANIFDSKAVRRVFEIKNRSYLKPLSILVSDVASVDLVAKLTSSQREIINNCLPGPYTFILNKRDIVLRDITGGLRNVGVRVPDCELACRLASIFPITTTSANLSDDEVLSNPKEILEQLGCEVDLVIDAGDLKSSKSSSVIDLTGLEPKVLRR
ncbi:L-threonylcarbamoyladenylate synthase [Methanobrevibacter sp.]|uniref:L-threonylcarbamoyladenylate synthase n=1 Tax=Methanobrevibacter sp. TaxID=66852 RepID=UPI0025EE2175|nr:L-threonylcarbamoyladenylate synthase [Methanobrevibacter sp.]MBQ2665889.1 threonylcarbamoyl-AMP synthase [Methanobrevibacter sp.]